MLAIHKELIVVTLLKELENGEISNTVKEFTTYPESLKQLAKWLLLEKVDLAVMESTVFLSYSQKWCMKKIR